MRVLVIEDDDDVALVYKLALERSGHDVVTAARGRDGLAEAERRAPDLVVLDGMLPDIDGLEVLSELVNRPATAGIPIVMASARAGGKDREAALAGGASHYIVKPFEPSHLAEVVDRALAGPAPATEPATRPAGSSAAAPGAAIGGDGEGPGGDAADETAAEAVGEAVGEAPEPGLGRLLSMAFDAIISIDETQRIVAFNKGAEITFGYLAEEVLGKHLDMLLPERYSVVHRQHVEGFADERGPGRIMGHQRYIYGRRRDGTEFPAEASITKLELDGQPVLTAILRDASERQRIESELRSRVRQQQVVADLSLRAITAPAVDEVLDDAVNALVSVLPADLVSISLWSDDGTDLLMRAGFGWQDGVVGAARGPVDEGTLAAAVMAADRPIVFEDLREDSRFAVDPVLQAHGVVSGAQSALRGPLRPVGLIGIYTTERRPFSDDDLHVLRSIANVVASAVQRAAHERRLRAFLDAAPDATVVVDANGRIISSNAQAEVLFGYTKDELLQIGVDALVPEVARGRHGAHRAGYAEERRPRAMGEGLVLAARRKDGSEVPVDIMLRPLDTEDGPVVVAAVRDVTERRRNESTRDAFLHAVSHELRTPLTSVLGFAALLTDHFGEQIGPDALDLAQRIRTSATKLDRLLGDMLDLDRLGRGVLEAQRRPVRMLDLVRNTVEGLALEGRSLSMSVTPEDIEVMVDGAQVERIIENLLVNALRHTPSDSPIDVTVQKSANGVLLAVEDRGPGVPDEAKEHVFEPFRREAAPSTAGTGIGLSLVARFAELHGGRAWVEDREGGGASFKVVLAT